MERAGSKALLILGMHRSGTSSLAGAMVRLGGAAPLNLLPPADDNPKGFSPRGRQSERFFGILSPDDFK